MDKSRIMFNMTLKEIREGLKEMKTVVIPVGCVEQHGYHMAISVDIHNAVEIAARASAITGCFVTPPMQYSFSGGTLTGTINLSPQVVSLVLNDMFHSLVDQGFKNIIVLLGHGGSENIKAARDACEMFQRLTPNLDDVTVSLVPFWDLSPTYMKSFDEGDFHAGKYETSMMLYWKPELVHMDQVELDNPELMARMKVDPDAYLSITKAVDSPFLVPRAKQADEIHVGVMGNPEGANAELGRTIAEEASTNLAVYIEKLQNR